MPIHDWTRVEAGLFHHFHQAWSMELCNALNAGALPPGYFALAEQRAIGLVPDVLALKWRPQTGNPTSAGAGVAVAEAPPKARFVTKESDREIYARKANRLAIRNPLGELVAVIELVSPGNKDNKHAIRAFVEKAADFLTGGVNLLVVDLFPPGPRDPQGIHKAIWDEIEEQPFELPVEKPLTVAAYAAGETKTAYVEPVAVGDLLPGLPLFLDPGSYVPAPLEISYTTAWARTPQPLRELVENPPTD